MTENKKTNFFQGNLSVFLLIAGLVLTVYTITLGNKFVSDDIASITQNTTLSSFSYVTSKPFYAFPRVFLYWLLYQIGGPSPFLFRLPNILFHLGSTWLIFIILKMMKNKQTGVIAASIFAVHPLLIESVTWISGGAYSQSTLFFLLAFYLYLRSQTFKFYLGSILAYMIALSSQGVTLIFPIIIFVHDLLLSDIKKSFLKILPFGFLSLGWAYLSLISIPAREDVLETVHYQEKGVYNPLIIIPLAVSSYFELIFWPRVLTLYHSELAKTTLEVVIRIVAFLMYVVLIIYSYFKSKQLFFWLAFFFICLLPTMFSATMKLTWIIAERYVYLAALGIFVSVALGIDKLLSIEKYKKITLVLFISLIVILGIRSIVRNAEWYNEDSLWIATGKTSPSSPNTHNNLGDVYGRNGDKEAAAREFLTAIALKPNYADAYHNLANTYREMGKIDDALANYQKAAALNPNLWQSYQNMAAIYFQLGQLDKSKAMIEQAVKINSKNSNLYINLGVIYLKMNDKKSAQQVFQAILNTDPENKVANLGLIEASK